MGCWFKGKLPRINTICLLAKWPWMDPTKSSKTWGPHPLNEGYINTHPPKLSEGKRSNSCKMINTVPRIQWAFNKCCCSHYAPPPPPPPSPPPPPPPSLPSPRVTSNVFHQAPTHMLFTSLSSLTHYTVKPKQSLLFVKLVPDY